MKTKIIYSLLLLSLFAKLKAQNNVEDFSFYPYMSDSVTASQDTLLNIQIQINIPDTNAIDSIHVQVYDVLNSNLTIENTLKYRSTTDGPNMAYSRKEKKSTLTYKGLNYAFYQVSVRLKDVNGNFSEYKTK
jgi:hypothetical protein